MTRTDRLGATLLLLMCAGCTQAPEHSPAAATAACEGFVKERLRAPASAQFPSQGRDVAPQGGGRYTVRGVVDSQNGFGALVRSEYACSVEWLTGGIYNPVSVTVGAS